MSDESGDEEASDEWRKPKKTPPREKAGTSDTGVIDEVALIRRKWRTVRQLVNREIITETLAKAAVEAEGHKDYVRCCNWIFLHEYDDDLVDELSKRFDQAAAQAPLYYRYRSSSEGASSSAQRHMICQRFASDPEITGSEQRLRAKRGAAFEDESGHQPELEQYSGIEFPPPDFTSLPMYEMCGPVVSEKGSSSVKMSLAPSALVVQRLWAKLKAVSGEAKNHDQSVKIRKDKSGKSQSVKGPVQRLWAKLKAVSANKFRPPPASTSKHRVFTEDESGCPSYTLNRDLDLTATLEQKIKAKESQEHIIGPGGGFVEELGCKITFPPLVLDKDTKFQTSVITDPSDSPEGKAPITPILECILNGDFKGTVQIEMQSWARPNRPQVKGRLYREDEGSSWKFVELVTLNSDGVVTFSTQHFTRFRVFLDAAVAAFGFVSSAYQGILTALGYTQLMTKNFLHINCDGVVAFVCCLSHPKLIAAVRSSLIESGFIHPLLMPEPVVASSDGRLSVEISCSRPGNLRIIESYGGVETAQQKSERSVEVSVLLSKMEWHELFLLEVESNNLFDYKGRIIMWFSLDGGNQQPISKQWPLKEKETQTVVQSTEVIAGTYVGPGGQMSETSKGGEKKVLVVKK